MGSLSGSVALIVVTMVPAGEFSGTIAETCS